MPSLQPDPACPAGRRPQQVNIPERPYHTEAQDTPPSPRRNQPVQHRRESKINVSESGSWSPDLVSRFEILFSFATLEGLDCARGRSGAQFPEGVLEDPAPSDVVLGGSRPLVV